MMPRLISLLIHLTSSVPFSDDTKERGEGDESGMYRTEIIFLNLFEVFDTLTCCCMSRSNHMTIITAEYFLTKGNMFMQLVPQIAGEQERSHHHRT